MPRILAAATDLFASRDITASIFPLTSTNSERGGVGLYRRNLTTLEKALSALMKDSKGHLIIKSCIGSSTEHYH